MKEGVSLIFVNTDKRLCSVDTAVITGTDRWHFSGCLDGALQSRGHMQEPARQVAAGHRRAVAAGSCQGKSSERGPESHRLSYSSSASTEHGVTSSCSVSSTCFQAQDKVSWDEVGTSNTAVPHGPESPALGVISQGINRRGG